MDDVVALTTIIPEVFWLKGGGPFQATGGSPFFVEIPFLFEYRGRDPRERKNDLAGRLARALIIVNLSLSR